MNMSSNGIFLQDCRHLCSRVEKNTKKSFIFLIGAHGGCREDIQDKQLIREPICAPAFFRDLNSQRDSSAGGNDSGAITMAPCRCAREPTEQEDSRSR